MNDVNDYKRTLAVTKVFILLPHMYCRAQCMTSFLRLEAMIVREKVDNQSKVKANKK